MRKVSLYSFQIVSWEKAHWRSRRESPFDKVLFVVVRPQVFFSRKLRCKNLRGRLYKFICWLTVHVFIGREKETSTRILDALSNKITHHKVSPAVNLDGCVSRVEV